MSKMSPAPMLSADGAKMADAESVVVFAIQHEDGTVFEKSIPNVARPNLTYGYLRRIRQVGQMEAEAWMMGEVLGDDGLEALENYEGMTPELDDAIKKRVRDITQGGTQNPKG